MKIDFSKMDWSDKKDGSVMLVTPVIDGEKCSSYFEHEWEALIFAGLKTSGISANDCNYLSTYICGMIKSVGNG